MKTGSSAPGFKTSFDSSSTARTSSTALSDLEQNKDLGVPLPANPCYREQGQWSANEQQREGRARSPSAARTAKPQSGALELSAPHGPPSVPTMWTIRNPGWNQSKCSGGCQNTDLPNCLTPETHGTGRSRRQDGRDAHSNRSQAGTDAKRHPASTPSPPLTGQARRGLMRPKRDGGLPLFTCAQQSLSCMAQRRGRASCAPLRTLCCAGSCAREKEALLMRRPAPGKAQGPKAAFIRPVAGPSGPLSGALPWPRKRRSERHCQGQRSGRRLRCGSAIRLPSPWYAWPRPTRRAGRRSERWAPGP